MLVDAFQGALNELGLADRTTTLLVAKRIIALAKAGVLDPEQLRDLTVKAVRKSSQARR